MTSVPDRSPGNHRRLLGACLSTGLALLVLGVGASACRGSRPSADPADRTLRIAFVPKGTNMTFWLTIHAGAIKAQRDLAERGISVELLWKGPLREDDREQQIQVVESFTSQAVDGIVLAPLDAKALVRPVEEAKRLGIPTVIVDSGLDSGDIVSFVATDNYRGGQMAADEMGRLLDGRGRVVLLRYMEGSASTTAREEGFVSRLEEAWPDLQLISADQHAGATRDTAKRAAENILNRFGDEIDGVFVVNESSTTGMLLALQDSNLAGKVKLLGFDSNPAFIDAVRAGEMHGFVLQNPFGMATLAVETMVDHLLGKEVPPRVDTGVVVVTAQNIDSPSVQELLHPPLDVYLPSGE
ncbi:MAG: substrate-binding domain-containing protein [Acidobacteria bacterium]|jgi:ribose transport system substrate-binding protein|nr:substrate-binding domain-containing protein [Acidobacteriota bacterium]